MTKNIKEINLIVHPGWAQTSRSADHPIRQELAKGWNERVDYIQANTSSVLVYVTMLDKLTLFRGLTKTGGLPQRCEDDIKRIRQYSSQLHDRLILLSDPDAPNRIFHTPGILEKRGLKVDTDVQVLAFGEYTDLCVKNWGEDLTGALELNPQRLRILGNLSFSLEHNAQVLRDVISQQES